MTRYPMQRLDDIEAAMEAIGEHLTRVDRANSVARAATRAAHPPHWDGGTWPSTATHVAESRPSNWLVAQRGTMADTEPRQGHGPPSRGSTRRGARSRPLPGVIERVAQARQQLGLQVLRHSRKHRHVQRGVSFTDSIVARRALHMTDEYRDLIVRNPNVCHGQAVVKGTRIMVSIILDALADGMTETEILAEYPTLTVDGIRAAAAYGADLARDEFPAVAAQ